MNKDNYHEQRNIIIMLLLLPLGHISNMVAIAPTAVVTPVRSPDGELDVDRTREPHAHGSGEPAASPSPAARTCMPYADASGEPAARTCVPHAHASGEAAASHSPTATAVLPPSPGLSLPATPGPIAPVDSPSAESMDSPAGVSSAPREFPSIKF